MNQIFSIFISAESILKILLVILPSFATYFITKYNIQKPIKIQTKKYQFEKVYLPLYKLTYNKSKDTPVDELNLIVNKIDKTISEHFELVFPDTYKLVDNLLIALREPHQIINGLDYKDLTMQLFYQIKYDYDSLKNQLGYPCKGIKQSFLRMTNKKKFLYIFVNFYKLLAAIYTIAISIVIIFNPASINIKNIGMYILTLFAVIIMNQMYKRNILL